MDINGLFQNNGMLLPENGNLPQYLDYLREDRHENVEAFFHSLNYLFDGIELNNKRIVEVGSGKGLMAIYAALSGAKQVTSIEPEMHGSSAKVIDSQKRRIKALGLKNVDIVNQDFNKWRNTERFDLLLSFASINHLYESPHHAMHHEYTMEKYIEVARKMKSVVKETGGVAIISDACRYGLFHFLKNIGINRPWAFHKKSSISFRIHQNPGVWKNIFGRAGFVKIHIKYPLPYKLRMFRGIVNTSIPNFFLESKFTLYCYT